MPTRIVVRAPNWIGDQILAYPFFHYLRQGYPAAQITVACVPWVASIQFRHLVDNVCVLPQPGSSALWATAGALEAGAKLLRALGPWDWGICLPNSFAAAWLLARAHVPWRRGYSTEGRGWLLHDRLRWDTHTVRHRAETYVHLLPAHVRLHSAVQEFWQEPFDAVHAWPVETLIEPPTGAYWVLAPGSTAVSRRWPIERFVTLARHIARTTDLTGLVVGGTAETAMADQLCQNPELRLADFTARGVVAAYWQIFRQARFTVSNDSGLAHVAALCGSPVYIVCGAANPQRTKPLGPGPVSILHYPVDCWPCERNVCYQPPARTLACLHGIHPEAVWQEIQRS